MCKMSCSDKMLRINALGLQGACLTHFVDEPIHLASVACGDGTDGGGGQGQRRSMYCHAEISRAICCRLGRSQMHDGASSAMPPLELKRPYHVNHPALHRASASYPPPPIGLGTGGAGHGIKRADRAAVWWEGGEMELLCHARGGGGIGGKTAVQLLQELCQSAPGIEGAVAEWKVDAAEEGGFTATVLALGSVGEGGGQSKMEARQNAAKGLLKRVGVCFLGQGSGVCQARQFEAFRKLVAGEAVFEGLGASETGGWRAVKKGGAGYMEAKSMLMSYLERTFDQAWIDRGRGGAQPSIDPGLVKSGGAQPAAAPPRAGDAEQQTL